MKKKLRHFLINVLHNQFHTDNLFKNKIEYLILDIKSLILKILDYDYDSKPAT